MSRQSASAATGSTIPTKSVPATRRRFLPCTPYPTTTTRMAGNRCRRSLIIHKSLEAIKLVDDILAAHRHIAFMLALDGRGKRAEHRCDDAVLGGEQSERRIGEQRVAGADRVDHPLG